MLLKVNNNDIAITQTKHDSQVCHHHHMDAHVGQHLLHVEPNNYKGGLLVI